MNTLKKSKSQPIKTRAFLSQIPSWERSYKKSAVQDINFEKKKWASAKANFTKHDLKIFGYAVMEDWEDGYMKELADIASLKGGTILELGFGMGISAGYIQKNAIKKHIIIEANKGVVQKAKAFARASVHPVKILAGFWEDAIKEVPDNSLDGILFDTYPLAELEIYQNHFFFFPYAYRKLKKGGVFTYYSDEIKKYGKVHLQKLLEAGFKKENIHSKVVPVQPPKNCEYWKAKTMLAPIIYK